ncbi:MAG: hypothetical protein AAF289_08415 [Cyanobacteria bacterium P01_A01_bin.135]
MKLANPLYYPLPVLVGAVVLVVGVRVLRLPSWVVLPAAIGVATAGAALRKGQEPERLDLDDPQLERSLQQVRQQAVTVAEKSQGLREEAGRLLTGPEQLELLSAVQFACDRAEELPAKIDSLARRMRGGGSLLSVDNLQRQRREAEQQARATSGVARQQWLQLEGVLSRNIRLAREGADARQAQVVSLRSLILEAAGVLQKLQNQLRTVDLSDRRQTSAVRALSAEFANVQKNLDLLIAADQAA